MKPSVACLTRSDLIAARRDGNWPSAAAERFGVSTATVQRAEARFGIQLPRARDTQAARRKTHRDVVADMRPREAIDYLLEVIERLEAPQPAIWYWPGVHLTLAEKSILFVLASARGRALSKETVMRGYMAGRGADDEPQMKLLDTYICRLRSKLAGSTVRIETHWGVGYSLVAPEGFVWPWEVAS